jgi:hypothetical protein
VTAARRSVELASLQYRDGAIDYQRVLDAERTLLRENNTLVNLRSNAATNAIGLYKALGGGWEISAGQPLVPDAIRIEMQKRTNWGDFFSRQPTTGPTQPTNGPSTNSTPPPTR